MDKKSILKLSGSILLCMCAVLIGRLSLKPLSLIWYNFLLKPEYTPPGWLFISIWVILYLLMGISLFMVLNTENSARKKQALIIFGIQLLLNASWAPVFLGLMSSVGGFFVISLLWVLIFVTFYKFYKICKFASYLLIPYLLWVSYVMGLNLSIWMLNH
jgi:translocator protein